MNRAELVKELAEKVGSEKEAEKFVKAFIEIVSESLAKGDAVRLVGFGTFDVKERMSRRGYNPQTGELMNIPGHKSPVFKAGKALKNYLK